MVGRLVLRPVAFVGTATIELLDHVLGGPAPAVAEPPKPEREPVVAIAEAERVVPTEERLVPEEPHVSEEPELVAESADLGAADGVTAELTIDEPWEGYRRARAGEVIDSLSSSSRERLAVIQLYESTHRARKSVLAAVERELKINSPPRRDP